jgi:hypothetical protein
LNFLSTLSAFAPGVTFSMQHCLQRAVTVVGPTFVNGCVEQGEKATITHIKTILQ